MARLTGCITTLAAVSLLAQQQPPTIRSRTTLVPVDVRVVDRDGRPLTDLKKEDFTVLENGVPQVVRLFATHAITSDAEPPGDAPGGLLTFRRELTPGNAPALTNARVFLIALGRGRLQAPVKGVDAMIGFVKEHLLPQDRVAVMAWNRATDFTTDRSGILATLERFKKDHDRVETDLREYFSSLRAIFSHGEIPPEIQAEIDAVFGAAGAAASHRLAAGAVTDGKRMTDDRRRSLDALQQAEINAARIPSRTPGGDISTTLDRRSGTSPS